MLSNDTKTWFDARYKCSRQNNGDLASITDESVYHVMRQYFLAFAGKNILGAIKHKKHSTLQCYVQNSYVELIWTCISGSNIFRSVRNIILTS